MGEASEVTPKERLRKEMAGRLPTDPSAASDLLVARLEALFGRPERVVTFSALPDEPDIAGFRRPDMLLTRTPDEGWLTLHPADVPLERHRWGFLQPRSDAPEVDPREVDVVLVPGVAFGEDGSRLGHGKGYYDELLSRMPLARRIGITWECRMVAAVPMGEHDMPMHAVVTEDRVRRTPL